MRAFLSPVFGRIAAMALVAAAATAAPAGEGRPAPAAK
jgi:hypothetical protein